jgi:hypothetical protein
MGTNGGSLPPSLKPALELRADVLGTILVGMHAVTGLGVGAG